jgi:cytochrome P450
MVLRELDEVLEKHGEFKYSNLKELKFLNACINEAVRLYSPGILIRKVVKPLQKGKFLLQPGMELCVSPNLTHRNKTMWAEPERSEEKHMSFRV